ncbi:hypothetical protein GR268_46740, partial [Rhizobium leguminosarum]|nr:hypothetical protein [Rhizobium leguminosarum]
FNVSINDFDPVRCEAAAPLAPTSLDALRADIATMLAGCGLAGYLEAQVIDVERVVTPNESDRQCGHVGLFPAVPGIVWNFAIATDPMPPTANITFGTSTYISTPKPAFATWTDLARLLAAVLTHDDADPADAALVAVPEWTTA